MIVDGVVTDAAWSIFFRFYLDEASHNIPMAQCRKLTQTSSDMKTWSDARYGGFLRFCTDCSLAEIRRHWALYAKSQDLSKNSRKAIRASFQSGMQSVRELHARNIITTVRAAGPLFLSVHGKGLGSYTSFWTMGVTTSKTSQGISTPYTNPTFAYPFSGKNSMSTMVLNPIAAFFLVPALALEKNVKPPTSITTEDLVEYAQPQFSAWFAPFKTRISQGPTARVILRLFVGESLAFCLALHVCEEQRTTEAEIHTHPFRVFRLYLPQTIVFSSRSVIMRFGSITLSQSK